MKEKFKKIAMVLLIFYMVFLFFDYAGVFLDNRDPVAVTEFYYSAAKEAQFCLAYQIYDKKLFDFAKGHNDYWDKKMYSIAEVKILHAEVNDDIAHVTTDLIYKDKTTVSSKLQLDRNSKGDFLIKQVQYLSCEKNNE